MRALEHELAITHPLNREKAEANPVPRREALMNPDALPPVVTAADYDRLIELVETMRVAMPQLAFYLEQELDQATIAADADPFTVQMGSLVRFRDHASGKVHDIQLVYPPESSLAEGRLSVLTPVGSALLGQQAGTVAKCRDAVGRTKTLTVLSVQPPNA